MHLLVQDTINLNKILNKLNLKINNFLLEYAVNDFKNKNQQLVLELIT